MIQLTILSVGMLSVKANNMEEVKAGIDCILDHLIKYHSDYFDYQAMKMYFSFTLETPTVYDFIKNLATPDQISRLNKHIKSNLAKLEACVEIANRNTIVQSN